MTFSPPSFLGSITGIDAGLPPSLLGPFGEGFGSGKFVFGVQYIDKNLFCPFHSHWGWDRMDGGPPRMTCSIYRVI